MKLRTLHVLLVVVGLSFAAPIATGSTNAVGTRANAFAYADTLAAKIKKIKRDDDEDK